MFNLITLHYGGKSPKYYGIELGSFISDKNGYGFLVIIYDRKANGVFWDFLYLSALWEGLNRFIKWF